jgi:acyl-CoA synthetase (AMP-forming)/AMP-acid ligase II
MIIRGGENIYPVEIENMIRAHPAVSDIAVFAVPDHYYGEIVGAAITLATDTTAEELRAYCDGRIAKFKVPARLYRVTEFPLTASGKIRKTELRDMAEAETLTPLA